MTNDEKDAIPVAHDPAAEVRALHDVLVAILLSLDRHGILTLEQTANDAQKVAAVIRAIGANQRADAVEALVAWAELSRFPHIELEDPRPETPGPLVIDQEVDKLLAMMLAVERNSYATPVELRAMLTTWATTARSRGRSARAAILEALAGTMTVEPPAAA